MIVLSDTFGFTVPRNGNAYLLIDCQKFLEASPVEDAWLSTLPRQATGPHGLEDGGLQGWPRREMIGVC